MICDQKEWQNTTKSMKSQPNCKNKMLVVYGSATHEYIYTHYDIFTFLQWSTDHSKH